MFQFKRSISTLLGATLVALLTQVVIRTALSAEENQPQKPKTVELALDSSMGVVLAADRNGMPAKTKLIPSASYEEYYLSPVVDGLKKRQDMSWQDAAWASEEGESPHGIEIQFSKPQRGGRFQVTWAYDTNGDANVSWWASRNYVIQVKDKAGDEWKTVVEVKNNQSVISSHPLPNTPFSFLRIYQLAGGGHPGRPNLMWVGQVELTD